MKTNTITAAATLRLTEENDIPLLPAIERSAAQAFRQIPALAWLITIPFFAAGLLSTSPTLAWALLFIPNGLNILWLGPLTTAVQHLVHLGHRVVGSLIAEDAVVALNTPGWRASRWSLSW